MISRFTRRVRTLFRRRRLEAEMAEEMRFHLEQRAADYVDDGLPAADARLAAEKKFGNLGSLQERARDTFGWGWLERAAKDLAFATRQLLRSPGFTVLAIITLGLGIGANTAMFSIFNSMILSPLPYPDRNGIERIFRVNAQTKEGPFSPADYFDFRRQMAAFGDVAAYYPADLTLSEPGQPAEFAPSLRVSANFFSIFRMQPKLGRDFRPDEEIAGNDHVVVITDRYWQNRFGGRPDIIGHRLRMDGEPHVIVGVLPAEFYDWRYLVGFDIYRPLGLDRAKAADRTTPMLRMVGRRAATLSHAAAAGIIGNEGKRLAADFPAENAGTSWRIIRLQEFVVGQDGSAMLSMLIGLSAFVLLIACSNLANLLLARTMTRAREFAVRAALGASRLQLLRPLIAESLLIAFLGGGFALLVSQWIADWLSVRSTSDFGNQVILAFDWRVLGWALVVSLITALAFGLAPALFAARLDLNATLKSGGRGTTATRGQLRFRQFLIVNQFALAMVLLAGAALFVRALNELNQRRAGWVSEQLVGGTVVLPPARYGSADKIAAFQRVLTERLAGIAGAGAVSLSSFTPFFDWGDVRKYLVQGRPVPPAGHEPVAVVNTVSSQYFDTVGTRLLAGRAFTEHDASSSPKVFIINQTMATALFGRENPIGRRIARVSDHPEWGEIVGVAADVKSVMPGPSPVTFQLYQPITQEPRAQLEVLVRTAGIAPARLVDGIRAVVAELDADLPVRKLQSADATVGRANYQLAVLRDILGAFALLGLGLAALGVYGIVARTTAQRANEFAVRLALGAGVRDITRLVLTSGLKLALVGASVGLFGAFGVSRLLAFGFPALDLNRPAMFVLATLLLVGIALLACWLPARRAGKVDAVLALRAE